MSDSTFEPNTFQTPNEYVDRYLQYLTGEEVKVLLYATRRILGFQKRQDHISLSLFTKGMRSKDGEVLDNGTGLSTATVKKCLANLISFGLIVRVEKNDSKKNQGDLWSLQWKKASINEKAMQERDEKKSEKQKAKMNKARSMRQTPTNGIEDPSPNGIEQTPTNGIETQNTGKPSRNTVKEGASATPKASDIPELVLFKNLVLTYCKPYQRDLVINAIQAVGKRIGHFPTEDDLRPFWDHWRSLSGNAYNLTWLDWAVNGQVQQKGNNNANRTPNTPKRSEVSPEEDARLREMGRRITEARRAREQQASV